MMAKFGRPSYWVAVGLLCLSLSSLACGSSGPPAPAGGGQSAPAATARPTEAAATVAPTEDEGNQSSSGGSTGASLPGGPEVVGTIQATVDGKLRTWTVIDDGRCLWGALVGGSTVSLIGYENPAGVSAAQIDLNGNPWHRNWQQPYGLGTSRFIIEFQHRANLTGRGELNLRSEPQGGATAGDPIFMSYTTAAGDYIHGSSAIQGSYAQNPDGTVSLSGRFSTSFLAERDSSGLDKLPGIEDGTWTVTAARALTTDLVAAWLDNCGQ